MASYLAGLWSGDAWRVIEGQHVVSTRKLVDSDEAQELLEELIEGQKPPRPKGAEFERLHYLLYTPFRYPPLRHGSRFGRRAERGIWYGSETVRPALAEVAYYRLLFLEGTTANLPPIIVQLTAFDVPLRSTRAVDLLAERAVSSPVRYDASQRLGHAMREDGVEMFRYCSARDAMGGVNIGLFSPAAFGARRPTSFRSWRCVVTPEVVELSRRDYFDTVRMRFPRSDFEVDGHLPAPAV